MDTKFSIILVGRLHRCLEQGFRKFKGFTDVFSKFSENLTKTLVYFQTFMNPSVKPSAGWITNTYFNSKFAEIRMASGYDP